LAWLYFLLAAYRQHQMGAAYLLGQSRYRFSSNLAEGTC
jgi:hypothetical protein